MKLLIIEGPDRCGKNTLIKNLVAQSDNTVIRHFGSAKGKNDLEKRDFQYQFFKKEFSLANLRNQFEMPDKIRYPRDLWIWNRAHLGEFVYGTLYRNTHPENWVFQLEELFGLHLDSSVYLLLLTAPPEFLCRRDDGNSFSHEISQKEKEIQAFHLAFRESKILNKKIIDVSNGEEYLSQDIILHQVNQFLNF